MGDTTLSGWRPSFSELLVQRRVARRGRETAPGPDAELEETEDDRELEDRVDTSETIESGDDADELDRANDDRRTVGYPSYVLARGHIDGGGRWSMVDRARPAWCAWDIAEQMWRRCDEAPPALTAGVPARMDCGVNCGVGSIGGRGRDGGTPWEPSSRDMDGKPTGLVRRYSARDSWIDGRVQGSPGGGAEQGPLPRVELPRGEGDSEKRAS